MTGCEIFLDPTLIFFYRVLGMPFANAATTDSSSAGFFLPEINECQVSFLQAHTLSQLMISFFVQLLTNL